MLLDTSVHEPRYMNLFAKRVNISSDDAEEPGRLSGLLFSKITSMCSHIPAHQLQDKTVTKFLLKQCYNVYHLTYIHKTTYGYV